MAPFHLRLASLTGIDCAFPRLVFCRAPAAGHDPMTDVPDILQIMDTRGWTEGATLLRHWMSHPSNDDPRLGIPDCSTVTLQWARGFSRAESVYQEAKRSKIWTTEHAKQQIRLLIDRRIQSPRSPMSQLRVDMRNQSNPDLITPSSHAGIYADRVAYKPMTDLGPTDALTASLGRFGYYFNVSGTCEPDGDHFRVCIDRVGVYIRDSYDFNDDPRWLDPRTWPSQPLGFWDTDRSYVGRLNPRHCWETTHTVRASQLFGSPIPFGPYVDITTSECSWATRVNNRFFRNYRERTQMGSDFFVYSDIGYLETNDEFLV